MELICGREINRWGVELIVMDILECLKEKENTVKWVPKRENKVAHFLANRGLSSNFSFWESEFPHDVLELCLTDIFS